MLITLKFSSLPLAALLGAGLLLPSCERVDVPQGSAPAARAPSAELRLEIEALIEKLAISSEPAIDGPVFTPMEGTPSNDPRVIAYEAAAKLAELGDVAFPQLLAHQHDERQSVAFRRVLRHTVGLACYSIVEDAIYNLPDDYRGSFYREGADGQLHERPRFLAPGVFERDTVEAWLAERQGQSLTELQIEALEWLIEQETRIGFVNEADRHEMLGPLQRQLARLKAVPAR